jgi:hypothetical protein
MPVKDKSRYPKNWKQIRARILERAGNCCEWCGVRNRSQVTRLTGTRLWCYQGDEPWDAYKQQWYNERGEEVETPEHLCVSDSIDEDDWNAHGTKIVLTIAHLDHVPENNDPENLRALCQLCHISYDKDPVQASIRRMRDAEYHGQQTIFG